MLAQHFDVDFLFFSDGSEKWIEKKYTAVWKNIMDIMCEVCVYLPELELTRSWFIK